VTDAYFINIFKLTENFTLVGNCLLAVPLFAYTSALKSSIISLTASFSPTKTARASIA